MSLRANVVANYVGQAYVTGVGILMIPIYLRYMGHEAYGLVGLFALMHGWFQLLDLGLSPTFGREVARWRGGALDASVLWTLLRTLEVVFLLAALGTSLGVVYFAESIASDWLNAESLSVDVVTPCIALMGISCGLRLMCGVYKSAIQGFERQVLLNGFNIAVATIRFITIIPVFWWVGGSPLVYFWYQLGVSVIELVGLYLMVRASMPGRPRVLPWTLAPLRGMLKFSLTIAFTASISVVVSQTDRLVLSGTLALGEFGYFTLGVVVAGAINLVGTPLRHALMPRLARLIAEGAEDRFVALYRQSTRWASILVAPVTVATCIYAEPLLYAWTGDADTARAAAPVLTLYALGNGILTMAAFQYFLQYAKGDLRLHLAGNIGFAILLVPLIVWAALEHGWWGTGLVWVGQASFYLLVWTWLVHRRLLPGLHWRWLFRDVLSIWGAVGIAGFLANQAFDLGSTPRIPALLGLMSVGAGLLVTAMLTSGEFRLPGSRRATATERAS